MHIHDIGPTKKESTTQAVKTHSPHYLKKKVHFGTRYRTVKLPHHKTKKISMRMRSWFQAKPATLS
jgi:hypothetical protein